MAADIAMNLGTTLQHAGIAGQYFVIHVNAGDTKQNIISQLCPEPRI